mgnify:CR=1 FL=1
MRRGRDSASPDTMRRSTPDRKTPGSGASDRIGSSEGLRRQMSGGGSLEMHLQVGDLHEIAELQAKLGPYSLSAAEAALVFRKVDTSLNGMIELSEFQAAFNSVSATVARAAPPPLKPAGVERAPLSAEEERTAIAVMGKLKAELDSKSLRAIDLFR